MRPASVSATKWPSRLWRPAPICDQSRGQRQDVLRDPRATSSTPARVTSRAPGLKMTIGYLWRQVSDPGIEPQPGNRTLPGRPDAPHRQAEAAGHIKVALILSPQQLNEYRPLPPRQGHNGQVEAVALVSVCGL